MLEEKTNDNNVVEEPKQEEGSKVENNSTIKTMRDKIKTLTKENLELSNRVSEVDTMKETLIALQEKDLSNTYGKENVDDAKKLINAGFDEAKIKSMLNKTDDLSGFDDVKDDDNLKNIQGNGELKTSDDKELDEVEIARKFISTLDR